MSAIPSIAFDATASGNSVDVELKYAGLFRATFATRYKVVKKRHDRFVKYTSVQTSITLGHLSFSNEVDDQLQFGKVCNTTQ